MRKKLCAAVMSAILLLSGCFGGSGYYSTLDEIRSAAGKGDIGAVMSIADEYLSEYPNSPAFMKETAVCCMNAGELDAAEKYLFMASGIAPVSEGVIAQYIKLLCEKGRLDFIKERFPERDEIMFRGKPLGEYEWQELLDMTGEGDKIGYRAESYVYDEIIPGGADGEAPAAPFGVSGSMSLADIYAAIGFSPAQAQLFSGVKLVFIDCTDGAFSVEVKESRYLPFSQHPEEEWELSLKYGKVKITFYGYDKLRRYSVGVLV